MTILTAPVVIDRNLKIIRNGYVAIRDGKTVDIGTRDKLPSSSEATLLELQDQILMPGLVNAHCHLDYTLMKGKLSAKKGFAYWITDIKNLKLSWSNEDYLRSIQAGIADSLRYGTTLLGNITSVPNVVPALNLNTAPRISWFREEIDIRKSAAGTEADWEKWIGQRIPLQKFFLAPHTIYTASRTYFSQILDFCDRHSLLWTTHVAESSNEWEMFCSASGPLYQALKLGRDMSDCGKTTPFQVFYQWAEGFRSTALLAHMNCLSDEDLRLLQLHHDRFSVVHCPRSHAFFKHPSFPLNDLKSCLVNLCLGTDSLASNEDLNMFSEMRKMRENFPEMSVMEILKMATQNGAKALGEAESWHTWADWISIPIGSDPFETIIQFADCPIFVMLNGIILKKA